MAATIDTAWAASSGTFARVTSSSSTAAAKRKASTLTAKKRVAWNPMCPSRAPNVQWRFHQKLLLTATTKASVAATRWWRSATPKARAKTARFTT